MTSLQNRKYIFLALSGYILAVAIGVVALVISQGYKVGFSGADEPAHFLNGYFITNYLQAHFGANPLVFASDYYIHYPKISIGHWPPAYYGFLGLLFLVLPATNETAFIINLLVSSLPAIGVALALGYLSGKRIALIGVAIYAITPLVFEGQAMFMLDQALAGCLVAATATWLAYAYKPTWLNAMLFAGLSALAILIKGNGWVVVFVPVYHILLTGNWRLLRSLKLYTSAVVAGIIVVPWYFLTAKIAADGFNYKAGLPYAANALGANLETFAKNFGLIGLVLVILAVVVEFRQRKFSPPRWFIISGCLSLILSTLTLQSLVPVDIVDRYMAPAFPAVAILALIGAESLFKWLCRGGHPIRATVVIAAIALTSVLPGFQHMINRVPKADLRMADVASHLAKDGLPMIAVIDGNSGAEGAFIAAMAVRDPLLTTYVARASKLFADSNFMGSQYELRFKDENGILAELRRIGARYVVIARIGNLPAFPHSSQISDVLNKPDSGFQKLLTLPHLNREGTTEVYESSMQEVMNVGAIRQLGVPSKARTLINN